MPTIHSKRSLSLKNRDDDLELAKNNSSGVDIARYYTPKKKKNSSRYYKNKKQHYVVQQEEIMTSSSSTTTSTSSSSSSDEYAYYNDKKKVTKTNRNTSITTKSSSPFISSIPSLATRSVSDYYMTDSANGLAHDNENRTRFNNSYRVSTESSKYGKKISKSMKKKKKKKDGNKISSKSTSILRKIDPNRTVDLHIYSNKYEDMLLQIPIYQILNRENEMRNVAEKQNVSKKYWNGSLVYKLCCKQGIIVYNDGDRKKDYYDARSKSSLTIAIPDNKYNKIDTKIKKEVNNVAYELLSKYYTKGIIYCSNNVKGPDILKLLEYFQILYFPSNMAFQSVAIFLRVRLWGDYYLQRSSMKHWIMNNIVKNMKLCRGAGFIVTDHNEDSQKKYYYQGRKLSLFCIKEQQAIIQLFEPQDVDEDDVDVMLRNDFAEYLQYSLPGTEVWFDIVETTLILDEGEDVRKRSVLFIDFHPKKKAVSHDVDVNIPSDDIQDEEEEEPLDVYDMDEQLSYSNSSNIEVDTNNKIITNEDSKVPESSYLIRSISTSSSSSSSINDELEQQKNELMEEQDNAMEREENEIEQDNPIAEDPKTNNESVTTTIMRNKGILIPNETDEQTSNTDTMIENNSISSTDKNKKSFKKKFIKTLFKMKSLTSSTKTLVSQEEELNQVNNVPEEEENNTNPVEAEIVDLNTIEFTPSNKKDNEENKDDQNDIITTTNKLEEELEDELGLQIHLPVGQLNDIDGTLSESQSFQQESKSSEQYDDIKNDSIEEEPALVSNIGISDFMDDIPLDNADDYDDLLNDVTLNEDPCNKEDNIQSIIESYEEGPSSNEQKDELNDSLNTSISAEIDSIEYLRKLPEITKTYSEDADTTSDAGSTSLHGLNLVDSIFSDTDDDIDFQEEQVLLPSIAEDNELRGNNIQVGECPDDEIAYNNNNDISNDIQNDPVEGLTFNPNLDFSYVTNNNDDTSCKSYDNKSQAAHSYTSLYDMIYDSLSDVFTIDSRESKQPQMDKQRVMEEGIGMNLQQDVMDSYDNITYNVNKQLLEGALLPPSTNDDNINTTITSTAPPPSNNPQQKKKLDMNRWLSEDEVKEFVSFYNTWKSELPIFDPKKDNDVKKEDGQCSFLSQQSCPSNMIDKEDGKDDNKSPFLCFDNVQSFMNDEKNCCKSTQSCESGCTPDDDSIIDVTLPSATSAKTPKAPPSTEETSTLDSITAAWLWENLHNLRVPNCTASALKCNKDPIPSKTKTNNAYEQALKEEELRIEAESVECMRLPVTTKQSIKQKIDLDIILEDDMKYLLSKKRGSMSSNSNGSNAVEIKYKLLKGRRPPRPKKVRSKASGKRGTLVEV